MVMGLILRVMGLVLRNMGLILRVLELSLRIVELEQATLGLGFGYAVVTHGCGQGWRGGRSSPHFGRFSDRVVPEGKCYCISLPYE